MSPMQTATRTPLPPLAGYPSLAAADFELESRLVNFRDFLIENPNLDTAGYDLILQAAKSAYYVGRELKLPQDECFDHAPKVIQEAMVKAVLTLAVGGMSLQVHQQFRDTLVQAGWTEGDYNADRKTHPAIGRGRPIETLVNIWMGAAAATLMSSPVSNALGFSLAPLQ